MPGMHNKSCQQPARPARPALGQLATLTWRKNNIIKCKLKHANVANWQTSKPKVDDAVLPQISLAPAQHCSHGKKV